MENMELKEIIIIQNVPLEKSVTWKANDLQGLDDSHLSFERCSS